MKRYIEGVIAEDLTGAREFVRSARTRSPASDSGTRLTDGAARPPHRQPQPGLCDTALLPIDGRRSLDPARACLSPFPSQLRLRT